MIFVVSYYPSRMRALVDCVGDEVETECDVASARSVGALLDDGDDGFVVTGLRRRR